MRKWCLAGLSTTSTSATKFPQSPNPQLLLSCGSLLTSSELYVGVTTDDLLRKKKFSTALQCVDIRMGRIAEFLELFDPGSCDRRIEVIRTVQGPLLDEDFGALVLSSEVEKNGIFINGMREEKGLKPIQLEVVQIIDEKVRISSTQIRSHIIEKTGGELRLA